MKKKDMLINVAMLSATSLLLKFLGMGFKIYLSNKIGAEGMGLYQLIFTVYGLMIAISCAGVQVATTRMVSEQIGNNYKLKSHQVVSFATKYVFVISVVVAFVVFIFSKQISENFIKNINAIIPLKLLCIAIIPVSISTCFKGFFTANSEIYKISISQIIEDFLKIFIVVFAFSAFSVMEKSCSVIMLSIAISEMISLSFLFIAYLMDKNKKIGYYKVENLTKTFCVLTTTLAIGSIIVSLFRTAENFLIPSSLIKYGFNSNDALEKFGMLKGMTMPILLFPSALIGAFSTLLIPEITRLEVLKHNKSINHTISMSIKITLLLSVFIMGFFVSFSKEIGFLLYKSYEIGNMIKTLSFFIPFMYLDGLIFTMLTSLNLQKFVLKTSVVDSIIRIALIYFLVPKLGFSGIIITMYVSNLLTPFCGILKLSKRIDLKIEYKFIIISFVLILFSNILTKIVLNSLCLNDYIKRIVLGSVLLFLFYFLQLLLTGELKEIFFRKFN